MALSPGVTLLVQREFSAQPRDLEHAWSEPELFRRWFQPVDGAEARPTTFEPRAGGALEVRLGLPDGSALGLAGRFREFARERVVLELARVDADGARGAPTLVTVTLQPRAGGTTLVLRHDGLTELERVEFERAWERCLGRLAGACSESLARFYGRLESYPRFRSRFGGLWPDLSNAEQLIAGKQALGRFTADDAARFRHWVEKGYVVLERAVPLEAVDRLRNEMERAWEHGDPRVSLEVFEDGRRTTPRLEPRYRDVPHKVLDYHGLSAAAREVQFAPPIRRFLEQLFERPPLAFQSLYFRWGSEQDMHQDTAYVVLRSPMELVGCWIALEDVVPGCGELQYYVGSHRIPEYLWFGRARSRPYEFDDDRDFLRHVREESERLGCALERFRPKKGDVLLWHADLVHGGSRRDPAKRALTRQSLVSHFCPLDVDPVWWNEIPSSPKLEHASGCWYCHPLPR